MSTSTPGARSTVAWASKSILAVPGRVQPRAGTSVLSYPDERAHSPKCTIHLLHKSVNENAVSEFPMILSSPDVNRTWALWLYKFGTGILTENFMNSEPSGILYCLIWVHELRTCRNARGRSPEWLTRSAKLTVEGTREARVPRMVRYGL